MGRVLAYVNHGRWVLDCRHCNAGIRASGEDTETCPDCGGSVSVELPSPQKRSAGERVLTERPEENRNWHPERESVADLKAENATRGFPFA